MFIDCNTRAIELTRGQIALVDATDFDWLRQWKWFAHWEKATGRYYACRSVSADLHGKKGTVWMHRQILGLGVGDGKIGDHVEPTATLDNRRRNLRLATAKQNVMNRRHTKHNRAGAKGCSWNNGSYLVRIGLDGKMICLGRRKNLDEAKALYAEGAKRHHGEFARS